MSGAANDSDAVASATAAKAFVEHQQRLQLLQQQQQLLLLQQQQQQQQQHGAMAMQPLYCMNAPGVVNGGLQAQQLIIPSYAQPVSFDDQSKKKKRRKKKNAKIL